MKAGGQDVLQEAAQKLRGVEGGRFPYACVALAIFEGGASVFFLEDALELRAVRCR
jgi:hypothetical protein